jgi:hypothetical protein
MSLKIAEEFSDLGSLGVGLGVGLKVGLKVGCVCVGDGNEKALPLLRIQCPWEWNACLCDTKRPMSQA